MVRPEPNHNQIVKPLHAKSLLPCPHIPWQYTPIAINLHSSILLLLLRSCWYPVCRDGANFEWNSASAAHPSATDVGMILSSTDAATTTTIVAAEGVYCSRFNQCGAGHDELISRKRRALQIG